MAGDSSHLTKAQFWASLGLVSLAQNRNGLLPDAEARSTLIGVGPPLAPPALKGLETEGIVRAAPVPEVVSFLLSPIEAHMSPLSVCLFV